MTNDSNHASLCDIHGLDDASIPLAETALRIALVEFPRLDLAKPMAEIARLEACTRDRAASSSERDLAVALDATLFDDAGFRGNVLDYYDPRNSFLNVVLERRTGIPITLAVLYIEIGRRLGLDLRGIGFPGHFLVGRYDGELVEIVDAFHCGARLTRDDCAQMLERAGGAGASVDAYLAPVTTREILLRMLRNLKHIYIQSAEFKSAIAIADRILELSPDSTVERRDRGLLLLQIGELERALADLGDVEIDARDGGSRLIREAIATAKREIARLN